MNIGVVGAGLLGQLLAFELKNKGYKISIFTDTDKRAFGSATDASAGMLAPIAELQTAEYVISQLGFDSIEIWKNILPTLSKKVFYNFNGSIVTVHPYDYAELDRFEKIVNSKANGHKFYSLDYASNVVINSGINTKNGFFFPNDGHIECRSLISSLNHELNNSSITWHTKTWVDEVNPYCIYSKNKKHNFDVVFDCRGHKAKDFFPEIRGVRGELLYLYSKEVKLDCPVRLLTPRYPIYIVPLSNHQYIVGASEIETEDDSSISVRSTLELLTAAYSINSSFAEARIIQCKVGHRPALPSNLPEIKYMPGLIGINGLYRHGFLIAPAMIKDAIHLLEGKMDQIKYPEFITEAHNG